MGKVPSQLSSAGQPQKKNMISEALQEVTVSPGNPKWVESCIKETSFNSYILLGHDADFYLLLPGYALNIDLI